MKGFQYGKTDQAAPPLKLLLKPQGGGVDGERDGIRVLCWAMVKREERPEICSLTTASLLGFSPVNDLTKQLWREAVLKTALVAGPKWVRELRIPTEGTVPDW